MVHQPQSLRSQHGLGLIEVMVSVTLLAITVLGYSALQLRAMSASEEASQHILAMNIAHDLAERMRLNRDALSHYGSVSQVSKACGNTTTEVAVVGALFCNAQQLAIYDFAVVAARAKFVGMQLAVLDCAQMASKRKCIYVAWGTTTPTQGNAKTDCTTGTRYVSNSQCLFLETYHYAE